MQTSHETWSAFDAYIEDKIVGSDEALAATLAENAAAGLPAHSVSASHGKLLHLLLLSLGAKSVLEIGTLGGYSAIWMARALPPEGRLVSLEINPRMAEVARWNIARAGQSNKVEVILGPALDSLRGLEGPFDLAFIDANKTESADYFLACIQRVRPGGLIVVDNVVRSGEVLDAESTDADVQGVRRLFDLLARERRVIVTALQTVGAKGYDGLAIARVS